MRRQCHDRNTTELLQREVEVNEFDAIRQLHDDAVRRREAVIEQIQGQTGGMLFELRISHR